MKKLILALSLIYPIELAIAHEGATGVVKERMEAMKTIGQSTKLLGNIIRKQEPFNPEVARDAARAIRDHAKLSKTLFPFGSNNHPSEVTDEIWAKPDEFDAIFQNLEKASIALLEKLETAKNPDDIKIEFGAIAKTCKTCHSTFRQKQ